MPRAEAHKSRLAWNKKEDEMGRGRQGLVFFPPITNMEGRKGLSSATTASPPTSTPPSLHLSPDAVIRFAFPCARKKDGLGIFIPCPEQLNANCRASGSAFKKKKVGGGRHT